MSCMLDPHERLTDTKGLQYGTSSRPHSCSSSFLERSVRPHSHRHCLADLSKDGAIILRRALTTSAKSTSESLEAKGVSFQNGRLSVKTDRAPPTREAYIANTQKAFEAGARQAALHPDAFKTGASREGSAESSGSAAAQSSAVDAGYAVLWGFGEILISSEKKGFQRTKKLA